MAKVEYGLQMYSLRDITDKDLKGALKQVSEMGYKYIEFAGLFGHKAEDVKAWLQEYGLVCSGTHTGGDALAPDVLEDTIAYHKAIGCDNLIIPGMDWSTREKLEENIALINRLQPILAENGIALGYHNHTGEFFVPRSSWRSTPGGPTTAVSTPLPTAKNTRTGSGSSI